MGSLDLHLRRTRVDKTERDTLKARQITEIAQDGTEHIVEHA